MAAVGLSRLGRIGKEGWKPWFSASKVLKSHIGAVREVIPNDPAEAIASSGKRCGADDPTTLHEPATNQVKSDHVSTIHQALIEVVTAFIPCCRCLKR